MPLTGAPSDVVTDIVLALTVDGSSASLKVAVMAPTAPSDVELLAGEVASTVGGVVSATAPLTNTGSTQ